eukprot:15476465-Alexandrium_andersonii.AAC.1
MARTGASAARSPGCSAGCDGEGPGGARSLPRASPGRSDGGGASDSSADSALLQRPCHAAPATVPSAAQWTPSLRPPAGPGPVADGDEPRG